MSRGATAQRAFPRRLRRVAIGMAALASALLAVTLGIASDLRVLLIGPSAANATVVRVKQELSLLGLEVDVEVGDARTDLATAAREHDAAAVARVEDNPPEIVLWVDAAHSGGTAQVSRVSESITGQAEPGLLALRAVELLRGRLVPVPAAPPDAAPPDMTAIDTPPAPAATATAIPAATAAPIATANSSAPPEGSHTQRIPFPPRPSRGGIHLGPAIVASPGGVPAAPMLRLGGGWRVAAPLEIDALVMIPLANATVSEIEGQIDLRVLAFGAGASVHFLSAASPFALHAGGGMGVAGLFFEGRAAAPWIATSGSRWTAMPYLEAGAGYRFTPLIGVRADVLGAVARPEPVLVIAGRETATFGTPLFVASIALEVHP